VSADARAGTSRRPEPTASGAGDAAAPERDTTGAAPAPGTPDASGQELDAPTALPLDRVLVIMPAWNEQETVADVIAEVRRETPDVDVLVVDDGSSDGTVVASRTAGAMVLELPVHLGVGGAMRAGYHFAARRGYQAAVQLDADGQHDPADVPVLLEALRSADIVIGARFAGRGEYEVRGPRRWAMRMLAWTMSRMTGEELTDVTSGFRAVGPSALATFSRIYPVEYLGDTVESLAIGARSGLRITQVPVEMHERSGGKPSQSPVTASLYLLRALVVLALIRVRQWELDR
jgi:glycosyltransferase involved in cell wall biosynthesis